MALEKEMIGSVVYFTANFVPLSVYFVSNFPLQALELSNPGNKPLLALRMQIILRNMIASDAMY